MNKPNPLSYGLLIMALTASALYAAVQTLATQNATSASTEQTAQAADNSEEKAVEDTVSVSQETKGSVTETDSTEQQGAVATQQPITAQTPNPEAAAEDQILTSDTPNPSGNEKFIPTESISEDLAVSFPVDI